MVNWMSNECNYHLKLPPVNWWRRGTSMIDGTWVRQTISWPSGGSLSQKQSIQWIKGSLHWLMISMKSEGACKWIYFALILLTMMSSSSLTPGSSLRGKRLTGCDCYYVIYNEWPINCSMVCCRWTPLAVHAKQTCRVPTIRSMEMATRRNEWTLCRASRPTRQAGNKYQRLPWRASPCAIL